MKSAWLVCAMLLAAALGSGLSNGALAGEQKEEKDAAPFKTLKLPESLVPQLDNEWNFIVCWKDEDLMALPLKYKGVIIAGSEGTFRKSTLDRWVKENKIDWEKHIVVVALRGYEKANQRVTLENWKVTDAEVRADIKVADERDGPKSSTVYHVVLCPRHKRLALYQGGPNPVFSQE